MSKLLTSVFFGAILLIGGLMISPESFWVDESTTAQYSQLGGFGDVVCTLWTDRNSEAQMPLYILSVWGWAKLVPATEWALRSQNLVWLLGMVAGALYLGHRNKVRWFPLVLLIQPFLWRYINEFRPYAMQMFFSVWQLAALLDFYNNRNRAGWAFLFMAASFGVCSVNMLGVIQTAVLGLAVFIFYVKRKRSPSCQEWTAFCGGGVLFVALGLYFLHTLLGGAGGAKLWTLSSANLVFALYELIGISGVGPSHLALRSAARSGLGSLISELGAFVVPLAIYGGTLMVIAITSVVRIWRQGGCRREFTTFSLILVGSIAGTCLLAAAAGWPFWGRHLASLFPVYVLLLTYMVNAAFQIKWIRPVVIVLFLMMICSTWMLRFSPRFAKEDYRQAVSIAKQARQEGKVVWWVAHGPAAAFYGLDVNSVGAGGGQTTLDGGPGPDLVFINRPEATDSTGAVRNMLKERQYVLNDRSAHGFSIWKKSRP